MKSSVKWIGFLMGVAIIVFSAILFDKCNKGKIAMPKLVYGNTGSTVAGATSAGSVPDGTLIFKMGGESIMSESFAPNLLKAYMIKEGYKNVQVINVKNGGTFIVGENSKGVDKVEIMPKEDNISYLDKGDIDVYMTSSEIHHSKYKEYVVGSDAIAIIVNSNSKITSLTEDDLKDLFTSDKMTLYCSNENSCTYKTFHEFVMEDKKIHQSTNKLNSDADVIDAVAKDDNGIGVVCYSQLSGHKVHALAVTEDIKIPALLPNKNTIESENYPLTKDLYFYVNKSSDLANKLLAYIETDEGQAIVSNEGFINLSVGVNSNKDNPEIESTDPKDYKVIAGSYDELTTEFRFEIGASDLNTRGLEDLPRVVSYLKKQGKSIVLVGFTDNIGLPATNLALSKSRALSVKKLLEAEGVSISTTYGFGDAHPIRTNSTPDDRAENRRVEIWVKK